MCDDNPQNFKKLAEFSFKKLVTKERPPSVSQAIATSLIATSIAVPQELHVPTQNPRSLPTQGGSYVAANQVNPVTQGGAMVASSPQKHHDTASAYIGVALSFTQTLLKNIPDLVDGNPVKMAFSIAKFVLEVKDAVTDNTDLIEQRIISTATQLVDVEKELSSWTPSNAEETQQMIMFKRTLEEEMKKLTQLQEQSLPMSIAVFEDNKKQIAEIFERLDQARGRLIASTNLKIYKLVTDVKNDLSKSFLKELNPSFIADHNYYLNEEQERLLRRTLCTPGTRVRILADINTWVNDTSLESPSIYWLFGPAGSGKSTIAYTIARQFDGTVLGGNFFCSRQFEDTRLSHRIIPTISYHLALRCKPFSDALKRSGNLDDVHHDIHAQLEGLLIGPWQRCEASRLSDSSLPSSYLIVIDALDEIVAEGGSKFLRALLDLMAKHRLRGLRIFATSRSDPALINHLRSFGDKRSYRLEEVPFEEAQADIGRYLHASLPHFAGRPEIQSLVNQAAGLFVYAATVVKYLEVREAPEQKRFLDKLLSTPTTTSSYRLFNTIDELYRQILQHAFEKFEDEDYAERLLILHTFVCAAERTSTSIVANLLLTGNPDDYELDPAFSPTTISDSVLQRLHAVLYVESGKVLWYHKSFPDFLFDKIRSQEFWCDQSEQHRRLTNACFSIMKTQLKFNIANIPSSFLFDHENPVLRDEVDKNIQPVLRYSCRNWSNHLSAIGSTPDGNNNPDALLETISDFLRLHVLFWIEAMNLIGLRGLCDPMLQTARNWAIHHDSELGESISKAASFATYFCASDASVSTPHLYISALATWPGDMDASPEWRQHFPRIPMFKHASQRGMQLMVMRLKSGVNAVAFSSDGRRIASGSEDTLVRVWDASTGEVLNVLEGHDKGVTSVAFSSDGKSIVSGSQDESIRVWDALTSKQPKVLKGHRRFVRSVAFSNDGSKIVSGSNDTTVRLWNALTGEQLKILEGHEKGVTSVAFSSDGRIASGSGDKSVRLWDGSTGELLKVLEGHSDGVLSVAFSSDCTRVVSSSENGFVLVWEVSTGKQVQVLEGHADLVTSLSFSSDGRKIALGSLLDKSVQVWDVSTGEQLQVLKGHTHWVRSVAFSSDGKRIISGSNDQSVRVWDASTGEQLQAPESPTLSVRSVAFSTDGRTIISGSDDKSVRIWDASTGEQVQGLESCEPNVNNPVVRSSDGRRIVAGPEGKSVRVWDASTGEQLQLLEGHTRWVRSVAFSADGRRIVSGSDDRSVRVWDTSTGEELQVLKGHAGPVTSVGLSSDGRRVVSGSADKSVRVWNVDLTNSSPHAYVREKTTAFTEWLLSPQQNHLMFVPLNAKLPDFRNTLTIPRTSAALVDLSEASLGPQWYNCYKP